MQVTAVVGIISLTLFAIVRLIQHVYESKINAAAMCLPTEDINDAALKRKPSKIHQFMKGVGWGPEDPRDAMATSTKPNGEGNGASNGASDGTAQKR